MLNLISLLPAAQFAMSSNVEISLPATSYGMSEPSQRRIKEP